MVLSALELVGGENGAGLMTLGVQRIEDALSKTRLNLDEIEFVITAVELFDNRFNDLVSLQGLVLVALSLA